MASSAMENSDFEATLSSSSEADGQLWSIEPHNGDEYSTVIARFHSALKPTTYLEVGVLEGYTLKLARCPSIAIDPEFKVDHSVLKDKRMCLFAQMSSDEFFRDYSPTDIFKRPIDMAFLDGMHLFEYLLRDFINVERHCKRNSVVIMHDCIPIDEYIGRRSVDDVSLMHLSDYKDWWAGDVWKVVAIILKYRSDLKVVALDAPPTGLVCVTNLDPSSSVLSDRYFEIAEEFRAASLATRGNEYIEQLKICGTEIVGTADLIGAQYWI